MAFCHCCFFRPARLLSGVQTRNGALLTLPSSQSRRGKDQNTSTTYRRTSDELIQLVSYEPTDQPGGGRSVGKPKTGIWGLLGRPTVSRGLRTVACNNNSDDERRRLVCQCIWHGMDTTMTCMVPANDRNAARKARVSPHRGLGRQNDGGVCLGGASVVLNQDAFGRPVVVVLAGGVAVDTMVRVETLIISPTVGVLSGSLSRSTFHLLQLFSGEMRVAVMDMMIISAPPCRQRHCAVE
jgi:hypothetical protein